MEDGEKDLDPTKIGLVWLFIAKHKNNEKSEYNTLHNNNCA